MINVSSYEIQIPQAVLEELTDQRFPLVLAVSAFPDGRTIIQLWGPGGKDILSEVTIRTPDA